MCALVHLQGASSLLDYAEDFYAGRPALTRNGYGKGAAFYQAAQLAAPFQHDFYASLIEQLGLHRGSGGELPANVVLQRRVSQTHEYLFLQNFSQQERAVPLSVPGYFDLLRQQDVRGELHLAALDSTVLRRAK